MLYHQSVSLVLSLTVIMFVFPRAPPPITPTLQRATACMVFSVCTRVHILKTFK